MNLILRRFYQSVDLADPTQVQYFLVLETEEGKELLLPVQKDTTEALVKMLYAVPKPTTFQEDVGHEHETEEDFEKEASEDEEPPEEPGEADPEVDDEPPGEDLEEVDPDLGAYRVVPRRMKPKTEEEVPSL